MGSTVTIDLGLFKLMIGMIVGTLSTLVWATLVVSRRNHRLEEVEAFVLGDKDKGRKGLRRDFYGDAEAGEEGILHKVKKHGEELEATKALATKNARTTGAFVRGFGIVTGIHEAADPSSGEYKRVEDTVRERLAGSEASRTRKEMVLAELNKLDELREGRSDAEGRGSYPGPAVQVHPRPMRVDPRVEPLDEVDDPFPSPLPPPQPRRRW